MLSRKHSLCQTPLPCKRSLDRPPPAKELPSQLQLGRRVESESTFPERERATGACPPTPHRPDRPAQLAPWIRAAGAMVNPKLRRQLNGGRPGDPRDLPINPGLNRQIGVSATALHIHFLFLLLHLVIFLLFRFLLLLLIFTPGPSPPSPVLIGT